MRADADEEGVRGGELIDSGQERSGRVAELGAGLDVREEFLLAAVVGLCVVC